MKTKEKKIYVISDHHFYHTNIIKYCDRPFNSVEEMNDFMIKKWNEVVTDEDLVYVVGDFYLGKRENLPTIVNQLHGRKILIKGNHDHYTNVTYLNAGFSEVIEEGTLVDIEGYNEPILLSHHPRYEQSRYMNLYGHVHNNPKDDDKHKCVCVEVLDYTPRLIQDIIQKK